MSAAFAALRGGLLSLTGGSSPKDRGGRGKGKQSKGKAKPAPKARKEQSLEYNLLLTAAMCLVAFGVVMVFSASSTNSLLGEQGDGAYFLKRTLMFGVIGIVALKLASGQGLGLIRRYTPHFLAISFGLLLLVLLPGFGERINGAQRWISAGPIQIQPSEIAKVALVLYGAKMLAERPNLTRSIPDLMPYLLPVGGASLLIMLEPDMGTTMIIAFSVAALLIAAGMELRHLALMACALGALGLVMIMLEPYRMERLTSFLNPGADASGAGFQGAQAQIALGSGGILGNGLGESVQKASYLPEAHTDMIAAVVGEELGLLGLTALVALYMMFGYGGFQTARKAKDRYARLLAAGLTAMIMIQAVINLYAVMGMAPLTGVTLPMVSYGNSSLIVTLGAVGLLLNIAQGGTATAGVRGGSRSPSPRPSGPGPRGGKKRSASGSKRKPASRPKSRSGTRRAPARPAFGGLRALEGGRSGEKGPRTASDRERERAKRASKASGSGRASRPTGGGGATRGDRDWWDSGARSAGAGRRRRA